MARCHRIGQTKPVTIYRLVTQDSVEEQALTRLTKKHYLSVKVTTAASSNTSYSPNATSSSDKAPSFSRGELLKLLRRGTMAVTDLLGEDWNIKCIEDILKYSKEQQTG